MVKSIRGMCGEDDYLGSLDFKGPKLSLPILKIPYNKSPQN